MVQRYETLSRRTIRLSPNTYLFNGKEGRGDFRKNSFFNGKEGFCPLEGEPKGS